MSEPVITEKPVALSVFERATRRPYFKNVTSEQKQAFLGALRAKYNACTACPLGTQGRKQVVFGAGNPGTRIMFVGEGPGRDEDAQGVPFIGRAGQLLTKMIEAMGLSREEVFISNAVKCRPPENRTPLPEERDTCSSLILLQEIAVVQPDIICALGATAAQALLGPTTILRDVRGSLIRNENSALLVTYHPAYLLRNPDAKKIAWADLQIVMQFLAETKKG